MRKQFLNTSVKAPRDLFEWCPVCEGTHFVRNDVDVFCCECGWDSDWAFSEAGDLDPYSIYKAPSDYILREQGL